MPASAADYTVLVARAASRDLRNLEPVTQDRVMAAINGLITDPRPTNAVKLHGRHDLYRIRVGDYRILYRIDDPARLVLITTIAHRRDVYR